MYRAWVEEVLGLKVRGDHLRLDPVIPGWWEGFHLRYRHGEAIYEIQVENPEGCERGVSWVEMDGQRLPDGVFRWSGAWSSIGSSCTWVAVHPGRSEPRRSRTGDPQLKRLLLCQLS